MLRVEHLEKTYADGTRALRGVSFIIQPGEFVAVLGKSGSGKSTLLRCLNRLVEPTSGRVFLGGCEITGARAAHLRACRKKIAMIFQNYNLLKRARVLTNVLCGRLGYTSPWAGLINYFSREDRARALACLERLGLHGKARQRAGALSGGQQQRVGIARALMQEPELILADEPVSSLDPALARDILDILREINGRDGVSVLCNLHLPELAAEYAHRIIALRNGEKIYDGPAAQFNHDAAARVYDAPRPGA